jgi:UvrD-like helicase C-terminal domain
VPLRAWRFESSQPHRNLATDGKRQQQTKRLKMPANDEGFRVKAPRGFQSQGAAGGKHRFPPRGIHRANGTEAHAVAPLGCEDQPLPSWRSLSSPDPERLVEERRSFYVAATRAKDRLLISHVAERGPRPTGGPSC